MRIPFLLSVADLSIEQTNNLIRKASENKKNKKWPQVLSGKAGVLLFEKPSLRTRVSFELAINQLGGHCLYLSPQEVQLGKREPVNDVAQVLGRYVDLIIARTFDHKSVEMLSTYSGKPVINALDDLEHPCQALADMLTIYEKKGSLKGVTIAYVGDGNNVAHSLILAAVQTGMNCRISSPAGYEINDEVSAKAMEIGSQTGAEIMMTGNPKEAVKDVDVVYTDVWTSMGQEAEAEKRRAAFKNYQVNMDLMSLAKKDALFMHPLPAHQGEEVAYGMLAQPCSVVYDQAENRLHAQRELLLEMFSDADPE
jgi:ornithine carbamoyltransferase